MVDSKNETIPTIKLAVKRSAERRKLERDTKLLQRLGATCRVAGDNAELKFKFPKTLHCLDLGAMASDDIILSKKELKYFFDKKHLTLRVEEKVDGGNVGISLIPSSRDEIGTKPVFRFQKRAHYISSASEPQYRGLDMWASQNARALRTLLRMPLSHFVRGASDRPALFGQRILFGEWLFAKHSKSYAFLPDLFLVFDVFDITLNHGQGGFVSAHVRDEMLRYVCVCTSHSVSENCTIYLSRSYKFTEGYVD